jgi:hypothetical protein
VNRGVEFHDSDVQRIEAVHDSVLLVLDPAYVHVSQGRPGVDSGEGHLQLVELVFGGASWEGKLSRLSGQLSDGELMINGETFSLLPLPFHANGEIAATLVFCDGARLKLIAKSVSCEANGPSRFVDTFAA